MPRPVLARRPRRCVVGLGVAGDGAALLTSCRVEEPGGRRLFGERRPVNEPGAAPEGRLAARPRRTPVGTPAVGLQPLGLASGRDGLEYVPRGYQAERPAPLVLMLHGAGGNAHHALDPFMKLADDAGVILLAPESRGRTWDVLLDGYGPDVAFIDRALAQTFDRYAVDPVRVAGEGFSDGASYALSLAIANGDLFTHAIAFSPGFIEWRRRNGSPAVFISHGTHDAVLPIASTSRRIVPRVREAGYDVVYREFDGPHAVPPDIAHEALSWFLSEPGDAAIRRPRDP
jgi:phospholipase/carboxylesterase